MPAPKNANTVAATLAAAAGRRRAAQERRAGELRAAGWQVTPPEQCSLDWHGIATELAQRLRHHAFCAQHPVATPGKDCPFCEDRAAFGMYADQANVHTTS